LDLFIIDNKQPRSIDILVGMNLNNQYAQQDFDRARNQVLKPGGISVGGVKSPEKFSYANAMNTALQTLKKVFDELNKAFFKQTK
jgi:pyrroline-5-carboxylate reductase